MERCRFGRTELAMPRFTLGCMRLMHSWSRKDLDAVDESGQERFARVVAKALDLGMAHIETAHGYGTCEHQLGRILAQVDRRRYLLQTKVRPNDDPRRFRDEVEASLVALGVQRLDLLAIHGINDYRSLWQACRPGGCLTEAARLRDEGLVDWIGFSGHGATEVQLAAIEHEGDGGFDFVNLHWYYTFQAHTPVLEAARRRNLGVLVISPNDKGGWWHTPPARLERLCRPLSPMVFNLLFCLARPEIHTLSIGAARPEDLDLYPRILRDRRRLRQALHQVDDRLRQAMREAVGFSRPDALWPRLPSWEQCPGYINVAMITWLLFLGMGWGLWPYAQARYAKLGVDHPWVQGCDAAAAYRYDWDDVAGRAGVTASVLGAWLAEAHERLGRPDG